MDADHALKIIRETRQELGDTDLLLRLGLRELLKANRHPMRSVPRTPREALEHVLWMLDEMEGWIGDQMTMNAKKWEKVQRWLGFVQGALWREGVYSIDHMRAQNTSES